MQITGRGQLANYTLSDNTSNVYTFPAFFLDGVVAVHSGTGTDNSTDLFWGKNKFIWNNDGDTATLWTPAGIAVAAYTY